MGWIAPRFEGIPKGHADEDFRARFGDAVDFLHGARGVAEMLEDIVRIDFVELPVGKRPGKDAEIVDDIHAGKLDDVVVEPAFFEDVAAAEVEFGFHCSVIVRKAEIRFRRESSFSSTARSISASLNSSIRRMSRTCFSPPPHSCLVPKLRLGTHLSAQLRCPVRASPHARRPATETEFRRPSRSQTEFGNEDAGEFAVQIAGWSGLAKIWRRSGSGTTQLLCESPFDLGVGKVGISSPQGRAPRLARGAEQPQRDVPLLDGCHLAESLNLNGVQRLKFHLRLSRAKKSGLVTRAPRRGLEKSMAVGLADSARG